MRKIAVILIFLSCQEKFPPTNLENRSLIPFPTQIHPNNEVFLLDESVTIYVDSVTKPVGDYLSELLSDHFSLKIELEQKTTSNSGIFLQLTKDIDSLYEEGYLLMIENEKITLRANTPAGLINANHSLLQLIPTKKISINDQPGRWFVPGGTVYDFPRYGHRGIMLDVARHFFDVEEVKKVIDLIALYKFNRLHLHLSDDQGWRIEIKSWPKLTEIGGSTEVGGGEGGYFTQEQYSELITYAAERNIMVIPEIDMPGHTNAALASYPELNCDDTSPDLYTGTRVGFSTLCTKKEIIYQFVDDVVREISQLTPGPYFHVGGDESHVTRHEDFIYFINRVKMIINSYNKQMIGWEEIAYADIGDNDIVQFWYDIKDAKTGMEKVPG